MKQYWSLFKYIEVLAKHLTSSPSHGQRNLEVSQVEKRTKTQQRKNQGVQKSESQIEMKKKSRASHKSVAIRFWTEAESLLLPTRSVTIIDAVIRSEHYIKAAPEHRPFYTTLVYKFKRISTTKKSWKPICCNQKNMTINQVNNYTRLVDS